MRNKRFTSDNFFNTIRYDLENDYPGNWIIEFKKTMDNIFTNIELYGFGDKIKINYFMRKYFIVDIIVDEFIKNSV